MQTDKECYADDGWWVLWVYEISWAEKQYEFCDQRQQKKTWKWGSSEGVVSYWRPDFWYAGEEAEVVPVSDFLISETGTET